HVAAVATAAGEISTKPQIRATFVGLRPHGATDRLDSLAEKFLFQFLPEQLQGFRHAAMVDLRNAAQAAREREDRARLALESLRQRQLAEVLKTAGAQKTTSVAMERDRGPDGLRSPDTAAATQASPTHSSTTATTSA